MADKGKEVNVQLNNRTTQYLTGLYNASGYIQSVERLNRFKKLQNYTAFFFNIKGFGNINKKYGSKEGDEIIKRYAMKLKAFVQKDEYLGHLGEDDFVALILKARRDMFLYFLSRVGVTASGKDRQKEQVFLSASVGMWDIDEEVEDAREVINRPSVALIHARYILHQSSALASTDMINKDNEKKTIIENFRTALENEEFLVFYQPKVDSRKRCLVGAEGLVRWKHDGEMVSPGAFIPPLEQSGEILYLDYYVLQKACLDIRKWIDEGIEPVRISVNFSRKDLADRELPDNINHIIQEFGVDKDLIEIEVTETVDDVEHGILADFINRLHELGIMTAIDDFGSGYSSLSTLREFEVHTLKIDRSFINTDDFSWKDEIILMNIITMAKQLGIEVLTEGVEREDQLSFVNNAGCDVIQGFYFDRPLPEEDFRKRLKNKKYRRRYAR
ncbi:MAG: EAL domain-containing protein [Lachnospiraceae bacterium]|nr:EAL domain-containing protein [Lachnospiraceae bacterium]